MDSVGGRTNLPLTPRYCRLFRCRVSQGTREMRFYEPVVHRHEIVCASTFSGWSSKTGQPVAEMRDSATGTAADERAFLSFSLSVMIGIVALINSGGSPFSVNKTVGAVCVEQTIAPVIRSLAFEVLPPSRCAGGDLDRETRQLLLLFVSRKGRARRWRPRFPQLLHFPFP